MGGITIDIAQVLVYAKDIISTFMPIILLMVGINVGTRLVRSFKKG